MPDWFLAVFRLFFDFIPRRVIVAPDEVLVVIWLGKTVTAKGSGWYVEWPFLGRYELIPISRQSLSGQVRVGGELTEWRADVVIEDAVTAVLKTVDSDETAVDQINFALVEGIASCKELEKRSPDLAEDLDEDYLFGDAHERLRDIGYRLLEFRIVTSGVNTVDISGWGG